MSNNLENGHILRGQEGRGSDAGLWGLALITGIGLLYLADTAFQRGARTALNESFLPQGAQEEFSKTAAKFSIVYEGQQQPGCVGDIEKVAPITPHSL